jgi:hypothetical protein
VIIIPVVWLKSDRTESFAKSFERETEAPSHLNLRAHMQATRYDVGK